MSSTNREKIIAIIVGILMILICLIIVLVNNNKTNQAINIKVYKHIEIEDQKYYQECFMSTDDIITINKTLKRVNKLTDDDRVVGNIEGLYKIVVNDDEFYAFDNSQDKKIFIGQNSSLYSFNSTMYKTIIDRCQ